MAKLDDIRVADDREVNRRSFLDTAIAYPVTRFLIPPKSGEPATASVVAAKAASLRPNSGIVFQFGNKPAIVVRTTDGELRAYSAVCTHLECTVQFKADTSQLWCACHNGIYDLSGNVVSGPPPRSLEKFNVNVRGEPGDEDIVVSRT